MGTISSSTGLVSGLDIQSLVESLMAIESRPLTLLKARIATAQTQQAAYQTLGSTLKAAKSPIQNLSRVSTFTVRKATSSNEDVLTASATNGTSLANYSFTVRALAATNQLVSTGFHDRDTTAVGAGTLILESSNARVSPNTTLAMLNGGDGVSRGKIRITDRSGHTTDVDLRTATTVEDVLDAINSQSDANVRVTVEGDHFVLTDLSGGTTSDLRVADLSNGHTAADLGIATSSSTGQIVGQDVVNLAESTRLARLNDGTGVRYSSNLVSDMRFTLADGSTFDVDLADSISEDTQLAHLNDGEGVRLGAIRITNRRGESAEVDLTDAQTVGDVKDAIAAADIDVAVTISGAKLVVSDSTSSTSSNLIIKDISGHAAADLGITRDASDSTFIGSTIYRMDTMGAVIRAIENADGNNGKLSVSISGNAMVLTDHTTGLETARVEALNGSLAARDLGLLGDFDGTGTRQSRDLIAGLNTVLLSSLHGGRGITPGVIAFTRRDGSTFSLDFSEAQTLADVMKVINDDGRLSARVDDGGTRLQLTDSTEGSASFSAAGEMAEDLGLTHNGSSTLLSEDLQLQYISENTVLAELNAGKGVAAGTIRITATDGRTATLAVNSATHKTVGDLLKGINALNLGIEARINANGDGIELVDTNGGTKVLTVAQEGTGTTAANLGILGTGDSSGVLTGSFSQTIKVGAADTLDNLVAKINAAGVGVTASVINDGTNEKPCRLVLTSNASGEAGRMLFGGTLTDLGLQTMTEGRNALVVVGSLDSSSSVVVSSATNTVANVVSGLTLNLTGTSETAVQVAVTSDADSIVDHVKSFVESFNSTLDLIDAHTKFVLNESDADESTRGVLFGESAVLQIQNTLYRELRTQLAEAGLSLRSLADVGLTVASDDLENPAPRLQFDEDKFREVLADKPEEVRRLFTLVKTDANNKLEYVGIAARLNQVLDDMTNSSDGLTTVQYNRIEDRLELYSDRAEDMQTLLDRKEARLYAQFEAMEKALSDLQAQQTALSSMVNLLSSSSSRSSSSS
ncbi:MAG: flagellar filament capping protein FliD [Phycisphaerae bacterium]|nr:flagellar filament capping protein FliD [Phycisphaerae bacterium]